MPDRTDSTPETLADQFDAGPLPPAPPPPDRPGAILPSPYLTRDEALALVRGERENGGAPRRWRPKATPVRQPAHRLLVHPDDIPVLRAHPRGAEVLAAIGDVYGGRYREQFREKAETITTRPASEGMTGLDVSDGRVYQEYNERIQSLEDRMTVFEEMRRSEQTFAACEALITTPLANTEYWFEPGDPNDEACQQFAEFLNWNLSDGLTRSFTETMREAALAIFYGFTWCYPRYEPKQFKNEQYVGWRQFAPRARATVYQWLFDDDGGLRGLIQYGKLPTTGEMKYVKYDIDELLLWTWRGDSNDPEGLGAFRQAFKAYSYKTHFEEFAAIRIERQALGIPVAIGPPMEYDEDDEAAVLAILQNLRAGEDMGLIIPQGWEIKLLELGAADVPFADHIERQRQGMLEPFLAQFLMLSQGGDRGSNALSKDASSTFFDNSNYAADWLCETINRYEVPRICRRNRPEVVGPRQPKLMHGKVGVRDLERYTRALELPFRERTSMPGEILEDWARRVGLSPSKVAEWADRMRERQEEAEDVELEAKRAATEARTAPAAQDPGGEAA